MLCQSIISVESSSSLFDLSIVIPEVFKSLQNAMEVVKLKWKHVLQCRVYYLHEEFTQSDIYPALYRSLSSFTSVNTSFTLIPVESFFPNQVKLAFHFALQD